MDNTTKRWWESTGVWGGIMAVLAAIASIFGLKFGTDLQEQTVQFITAIASGFGGLLAVYGRVIAREKIAPAVVDEQAKF